LQERKCNIISKRILNIATNLCMTFICRELRDIIMEIRSDFRQVQSKVYRPTQIRSKRKVVMAMTMMMMTRLVITVMTAVTTTKMMTHLYLWTLRLCYDKKIWCCGRLCRKPAR